MEDVYSLIKNAVIRLLKGIDLSVDVFSEEIKRTEDEDQKLGEYYFLTLLPTGNETVSRHYTDRSVLVDIAYYHSSESNGVYLKKMSELDMTFRPVLRFGDRAIAVKNVGMKTVDYVLHYTFSIDFRDCREEKNEFLLMEELETSIKGA